jgi:hypothetical protein
MKEATRRRAPGSVQAELNVPQLIGVFADHLFIRIHVPFPLMAVAVAARRRDCTGNFLRCLSAWRADDAAVAARPKRAPLFVLSTISLCVIHKTEEDHGGCDADQNTRALQTAAQREEQVESQRKHGYAEHAAQNHRPTPPVFGAAASRSLSRLHSCDTLTLGFVRCLFSPIL